MELSAQAAWDRFGFGNGANSLDEKLQRLNSFSSSSVASQVSSTTVIGNTIVDDVLWLDDPLEIESIGIHVAPQVVRGRSITDEEEQTLLGHYVENVSDQTRLDSCTSRYVAPTRAGIVSTVLNEFLKYLQYFHKKLR